MMFHEIKGTKWDHYNRILSDELYKAYIDTWGKIKIEEGEQPENKLELKETTPEEQQYNVEKNRAWLEKFRPDELLISDGKEDMERWQYEESKADYKRMEEWSREYDRKHGKQ